MIWLFIFYAFLFSAYCFGVAYIFSDYFAQRQLQRLRSEVKNEVKE